MSLLKPAQVEQSAAKVGLFGRQGSGKTTTSALLAIGLSKTFHGGASIAMMDTENGSDYLVDLCATEGVKLLVFKSRAYQDMRQGLSEAEAAGACAYIVDSYTAAWSELTDSFKQKSKRQRLEFHHMDALKALWREWTTQFLNSQLHVLLAGRLGYEWDREEDDEDGTRGELIKLGTKMKGEAEAGYEPSLLIELEGLQDGGARVKKTRGKKSTITHHAYVLKDRWRVLNGRTFTFKDLNVYKAGDYKKVFEAFRPHFDRLAIGTAQHAVSGTRSSVGLFDGEAAEFGRRRDIALEEIKESIAVVLPGQDAKSKAARQLVLEKLFHTLSWSKVETLKVVALEYAVKVLTTFREKVRADRDLVTTEEGLEAVLDQAIDAVGEPETAETADAVL